MKTYIQRLEAENLELRERLDRAQQKLDSMKNIGLEQSVSKAEISNEDIYERIKIDTLSRFGDEVKKMIMAGL